MDPNAAPPVDSDGQAGLIADDPDALAARNYQERVAQDAKDREEKETKERIAKAQNRLALNAKLKGSTLGSASASGVAGGEGEDDDDALSWIKKQKKRQKKLAKELELAKKREADQDELEQGVYGEQDLRGLKVAHDMDDIEEGQEMILTLKDNRILDGDEDELQNVNLADYDRDKATKERKRKAKAQYTGYDDEEFEEGALGKKKDVLSKYDDEFAGLGTSEGFRLGAVENDNRGKKAKMDIQDDDEVVNMSVNRTLMNLDYTKNFDVSDYATEDTTAFKKKKKKSKRSTRRADIDAEADGLQEAGGDAMEDVKPTLSIDREVDENLVDDDELQMALARQRRQVTKKRKPDDVAAKVMALRRQQEQEQQQEGHEDVGNVDQVTFDDTSEFVRNVSLDNLIVKKEPKTRDSSSSQTPTPSAAAPAPPSTANLIPTQQPDVDQKPVVVKIETDGGEPLGGYEMNVEVEAGNDDDDDDDDNADDEADEMLAEMALRQGVSLEEMRQKMDAELIASAAVKQEQQDQEEEAMVGKPEPMVSGGMAGVLSMLRNSGAMQQRTAEESERERIQRERDLWLADHRRRIAARELERIKARGGQKDQAQREWENKMREQQEAREAVKEFEKYKPDVNIVYTDEFGRGECSLRFRSRCFLSLSLASRFENNNRKKRHDVNHPC